MKLRSINLWVLGSALLFNALGVAVGQGVELPAVPAEVLSGSPLDGTASAEGMTLPTLATVTVREGVTEIIPISSGFVNRITTPFNKPKVITAQDVKVQAEGRSVYVTASGSKPVGLFITASDPQDDRTISLGLHPKAIPPRTISLTYDGESKATRVAAFKRASGWETETPYTSTIMRLMASAARQRVPGGYSLEKSKTVVACDIPGLRLSPGQVLDGANLALIIMVAKNTSGAPLTIKEDRCFQPGVAAVSAWPNVNLNAGEETELYVAVNKVVFFEEKGGDERRPSLVGDSTAVYGASLK